MQLAKPASTSLDDAALFLSRVVPWDGEAFVNVHWRFQGEGYDRPAWGGRATKSVGEAVGSIRFQLRKPSTLDIYVCLSTQRVSNVKEHNGRSWHQARRERPNAVALKCLWVDVDIKDAGYASTKEALGAVYTFCNAISLPTPTIIVQTGSGGLHCYWVMDRILTPQEWSPLAHALANATKAHGLRNDTQCIVDSVRILRIPQTFNHKSDPPREVKLGPVRDDDYPVETLWKALEPYQVALPSNSPLTPKLNPDGSEEANDDLSGGVEKRPPIEIDLKEVLPECGFLRTAVATGGRDYGNPLWMLTTLIATFTKNGERNAHIMADGHATYTKEETDRMYERKLRDRTDKALGWPACSTISASGCTACATCPHLAKGRTPLHFTTAKVAQQANAPVHSALGAPPITLPSGYRQSAEGRIQKELYKLDGSMDSKDITLFTMHDVWLQAEPWTLHFVNNDAHGSSAETIPLDIVHGDQLPKALMGKGLAVQDSQVKELRSFLVAWVHHLRQTKGSIVKSVPYGWSPDRGPPTGFTFGGKTWSKNGARLAASGDSNISRQFSPVGSREPWLRAAKFITDQGRQDLCAILATSFAGPLMRFTSASGVIVSGYSRDSGIGKTTAMKIAQSVWGHPKLAMQGLKDSQKSVLFKLGELRNLTIYWDELQNEQHTKTFVEVVFATSEGKENSRLTRNVTMRQAGDWDTMMVVASNDSVSDAIARSTASTTAGINRVFEFPVVKASQQVMTSGEANQIWGEIVENYGNIGVEYAQWLGERPDEVRALVQETLISLQKEVVETTEERLWTAAMSTILLGARFANDLGFTDFDLAALKEFLISSLQDQRKDKTTASVDMNKELNISSVLQQFLKATHVRNTVVTDKIHVGAGKPVRGAIIAINDLSRVDSAQVHFGQKDGLLRISLPYFTKWLKDNHYSAFAVRKAMEEKFGTREMVGRIGVGTEKSSPFSERIVEIDLTNPSLNGVVDI